MLLLPIGFIKDAARSVKRICMAEFKECKESALTELLGIAMLAVTMYAMRREGDHNVLHLWCVHREEVAVCTVCGAICEKVHDEKQRCVRHLDIWMHKTFIHFTSRRFSCDQCSKTFTEELPFVGSVLTSAIES